MQRGELIRLAVVQHQVAELSIANSYRILQDRLENRLQLARRHADDEQHLGCCRLLLQRLAKLAVARFERLFQIASVRFELFYQRRLGFNRLSKISFCLRSGRTNLATTRSAFRALARQDHPRSTSRDPSRATDI